MLNVELAAELFRHSTKVTGASWPAANQVVSPCPTLKVIGAVSTAMTKREELKRMRDRPGLNADGSPIQVSSTTKAVMVADKVMGSVVGNTVGRVGGFLKRRLLGKLPEEALKGSYAAEEAEPAADGPAAEAVESELELRTAPGDGAADAAEAEAAEAEAAEAGVVMEVSAEAEELSAEAMAGVKALERQQREVAESPIREASG